MKAESYRVVLRLRRKKRIRKKIHGTSERPRLSLFKSARHVYAQVIDDVKGITLASVSSFAKGQKISANQEGCLLLGKELAEKCLDKKILQIAFDKNGYKYHGRVKAFADGARTGGLVF